MAIYGNLSRAQLSFDYLHTNSTTHEFLFGALAELVDNARDASATKINIYSVPNKDLRGGFMLCVLDDGDGMDQDEASDIITFGKSVKRSTESQLIGMYGNGLKSGSMRIGNDLMVFTKKGPIMTCVLLSRTFHEEENIDEIIVPMPVFETTTKKPATKTGKEKEKHNTEMKLILKYSPFKTEADFMKEFDRIEGVSGTLVVVYNLKLLDNGEPELDVSTDQHDIILSNPQGEDFDTDEGMVPERKSFRAYTSILYADPRMKIYIQNKKVATKRLVNSLYKPRMYRYSSARFKTRSANETKKAQEEAKIADNKAREAESKYRNLENKYGTDGNKSQRAEIRKAQTLAMELRREAQLKKQIAERKTKALRDPKTLNMIFGVNLQSRTQEGMFVYNCSRLIKMYQRVGLQTEVVSSGLGITGIVDVPYMVLEPTHNKQDFADAKEYRHLQKAMGEYLLQYWRDINFEAQGGAEKFWEGFGYLSSSWDEPPSEDPKFLRKRAMQIQTAVQCVSRSGISVEQADIGSSAASLTTGKTSDLCRKWRIIPFSTSLIGKEFPDDWVCNMNPDPSHNRCSTAEQKVTIPEGVLRKEVKSQAQKQKDLEEDIRKKQDQLDKMQKHKVVTSGKQLRGIDDDDDDEDEDEDEDMPVTKSPMKRARDSISERRSSSSSIEQSIRSNKLKSRSAFASITPRRAPKRNYQESDDEDDDDDFGLRAAKKSPQKPLIRPKPSSLSSNRSPFKVLRGSSGRTPKHDTDSDDIDEKKVRPQHMTSDSDDDVGMDSFEPDDGRPDGQVNVHTKVEAKVAGKWYYGRVIQINKNEGKLKIKFDKYPKDKYDKWFPHPGGDIRVPKNADSHGALEGFNSSGMSPASVSSHEATHEAPSSSTSASASGGAQAQVNEDIANGYRTCLRYFLPPNWVMDKEAVSALSVQELSTFPLDDFFDHYEKGLRKLVSSFQLEAQTKQQEADQSKTKLSQVRKLIAKLLKSINEEFDIDPECDTEQVDELLSACVTQAMQEQTEQQEQS